MPAMHAGVVSRNLQRERVSVMNKQGGPPPHPYVPRSASGRPLGKPPTSRGHVKHSKGKGKKGKKGKKDQYDLIVNIDLDEWQLTDEQVAEFKEVFMLFDKDEDGVLTFPELNVVMKSLGQRPSEKDLLKMVRDVSEDQIYDTIEFNEFLQMMSKQQRFGLTEDSLKEAFQIFDKDDDGFISVDELRHIMQSLGEKMGEKELDEMVTEADRDNDGLINYEEFVQVLCSNGKSGAKKKKKKKKSKENKENLRNNNGDNSTTAVMAEDGSDSRGELVGGATRGTTTMTNSSSSSGVQDRPGQERPRQQNGGAVNGNTMSRSSSTASEGAAAAAAAAVAASSKPPLQAADCVMKPPPSSKNSGSCREVSAIIESARVTAASLIKDSNGNNKQSSTKIRNNKH